MCTFFYLIVCWRLTILTHCGDKNYYTIFFSVHCTTCQVFQSGPTQGKKNNWVKFLFKVKAAGSLG